MCRPPRSATPRPSPSSTGPVRESPHPAPATARSGAATASVCSVHPGGQSLPVPGPRPAGAAGQVELGRHVGPRTRPQARQGTWREDLGFVTSRHGTTLGRPQGRLTQPVDLWTTRHPDGGLLTDQPIRPAPRHILRPGAASTRRRCCAGGATARAATARPAMPRRPGRRRARGPRREKTDEPDPAPSRPTPPRRTARPPCSPRTRRPPRARPPARPPAPLPGHRRRPCRRGPCRKGLKT